MLSDLHRADADFFEALRAREFARLDAQGIAYLDYAAAGLYGASQVAAYAELLGGVFGNPHSESAPSRASTDAIEAARAAVLAYIGLDPAEYAVIFTANTSAAIKLVAEAYRFGPRRGFVLSADNHNSVNGIREYARRAGAPVAVLPLDSELRLDDPIPRLAGHRDAEGGLFAFPAQSNFSGVKHPLSLIADAQRLGYDVLIDAAGLRGTALPDLAGSGADFIALSFYKLFGLPTGVGALIARHAALGRLDRPWFAGGTVDFVSVQLDRHQLTRGAHGFEDGTPNFLNIAAVPAGFAMLCTLERDRACRRLDRLTARLLGDFQSLRHRDGAPLVQLYGPQALDGRGATLAFNLLAPDGLPIPYVAVEARARDFGVALRGGCFCNPGASEAAFGLAAADMAACLAETGADFSIPRLAACLGPAQPIGALRISLGCPTSERDLDRAADLVASFAA
jgi:selenocysteine lyase/cysteine desulfurase